MQNRTYMFNTLNEYARTVINMADDVAASATKLKGSGFKTFIETRQEFENLIKQQNDFCLNCAGKICRFSTPNQILSTVSCVLNSNTSKSIEELDSANIIRGLE